MPNTRATDAAAPSRVSIWPYPREPRKFLGAPDEDVEDWLKHYERVSKYNHWDPASQLANVPFSLDKTALVWFENNEEKLTTWDNFVTEIKKSFGDSGAKKKKAEQTLAQRAQVPGETCTTYIEEVLQLCRLVNRSMSDEDQVGHLLKGIAEDAYNFLITKEDLVTAQDVIRHCRAFEALKMRRIAPKFGRLANVTTVASVDFNSNPSEDIASLVRRIIREELGQQSVCRDSPCHHCPAPVRPVYHQCALQESPEEPPMPWCEDSSRCRPTTFRNERSGARANRSPFRRFASSNSDPPRRPPDDHRRPYQGYVAPRPPPVCYNCDLPGHISRFCPYRLRQPQGNFARPPTAMRNNPPYDTTIPTSTFYRSSQSSNMRHDSPASDRSFSPPRTHQARSPSPRGRRGSPTLGN